MTQMQIVENKGDNWGYCLRDEIAVPSATAITISVLSAFFTLLLALAHAGPMPHPQFGAAATAFAVPLIVASALPLSINQWLHANRQSYFAFLPLFIVMFMLTLAAAAWLVFLRWFRRAASRAVVVASGAKKDGEIQTVAVASIDRDDSKGGPVGP